MNIVLAGARERIENPDDKEVVEGLIGRLLRIHGRRLHIVSVGCDKGVGKIARDFCMENQIIFVEVRMKLEGKDISRSFFAHVFQARNPALVVLGDEFYIFKGPSENSFVEGIVDLAVIKVSAERVWVYSSDQLEPEHPKEPQTLEQMAVVVAGRIASRLSSAQMSQTISETEIEYMALQEINRMVDVWKSISWLR